MGSGASFFVSYTREDSAYVTALADHLRRSGVPVWFDADLRWGERFTEEIRKRITDALGVIVVMSPAAQKSAWVEREVLEGQRHDREFLPVLLRGERLFLLASSNYFDARGGALPGEREIRELARIRDARESPGGAPVPPLALPAPSRVDEASGIRPSAAGLPAVDARRLLAILDEGQVEHADILTTSLILEAAGRLGDGWLRRSDGDRLPFAVLRRIDAGWTEHSQGAQGFRVQLALHGTHPAGAPAGRQRDFAELALALGWKANPRDTIPRYGAFVRPVDPNRGFFPTLRNPQLERHPSWHDKWLETVMAVHLRLRQWGGR